MTRRTWFRALLGAPVLVRPQRPVERVLMPVSPICPRCGLYVPFGRSLSEARERLPETLFHVTCTHCGWSAVVPWAIPIPSEIGR